MSKQPKNPHRSKELDKYVGEAVEVTLSGDPGRVYTGILAFVDEFSRKYGYNLPGHYVLRGRGFGEYDLAFRKSYVKSIKKVKGGVRHE